MPFAVFYDATVLYPDALRDLHIRIALAGLVRARWSREIVEEATGALARNRPDIPLERLERLRYLINESVPDCLVTGYEPLIEILKLPDPDDRHRARRRDQVGRAGARDLQPAGLPSR